MDAAVYAKFTQHEELGKLLRETGERKLVEDSPRDAFWGVGKHGTGRNELGKCLMRCREKLLRDDEERRKKEREERGEGKEDEWPALS